MGLLGGFNNYDEPATPLTRTIIQPKHNHVIHCALGFNNPIDLVTLKNELSNSVMLKIPRFSSLLFVDPHDGAECWKKTSVNIDDHIIIHHDDDDDEDAINSYLADIAISPPMSMDKPLWEIHVLNEHKCIVIRVHHAVADGMSLMSLLWTMGRPPSANMGSNNNKTDEHDNAIRGSRKNGKKMELWEVLKFIWLNIVAGLSYLERYLWVKDRSVISGIEGVDLWPRKVATARFKISDMKTIKNAIPNATINDVLYGILWCGLTRYLTARHPQTSQDGAKITGLCPINLREKNELQDLSNMVSSPDKMRKVWGNKFALVLLPVTYYKCQLNPLTYTARAKAVMDQIKQLKEAQLHYNLGRLVLAFFGSKVAGDWFYNLFSNTSFVLSNMVGPQEEISIAGNPVSFIRVTSSSQPHAITFHMVSYAGNAELQIQVAKDVIPDPKFLVKCFEDAFLEMKEDA